MWLPTHILGKNTQRICGKLHRIMWIYTQIIWAKVTYGRMVFTSPVQVKNAENDYKQNFLDRHKRSNDKLTLDMITCQYMSFQSMRRTKSWMQKGSTERRILEMASSITKSTWTRSITLGNQLTI